MSRHTNYNSVEEESIAFGEIMINDSRKEIDRNNIDANTNFGVIRNDRNGK